MVSYSGSSLGCQPLPLLSPYLYGHNVKAYTDHSAVKTILQTPNANSKHARWWLKVFGKDNISTDALSRSRRSAADGTNA